MLASIEAKEAIWERSTTKSLAIIFLIVPKSKYREIRYKNESVSQSQQHPWKAEKLQMPTATPEGKQTRLPKCPVHKTLRCLQSPRERQILAATQQRNKEIELRVLMGPQLCDSKAVNLHKYKQYFKVCVFNLVSKPIIS